LDCLAYVAGFAVTERRRRRRRGLSESPDFLSAARSTLLRVRLGTYTLLQFQILWGFVAKKYFKKSWTSIAFMVTLVITGKLCA